MSPRKANFAGLVLLSLSLVVSACQSPTVNPAPPTPSAVSAQPTAVPPTPEPTVPPKRSLVVCVGQEPQTLYMYASASRSMWSVLEALYDGPVDTRGYTAEPVILQKLPSLADGDAVVQPVTVRAGDEVQDAGGNLVTLAQGVRVLPTGCSGSDCAVDYDGSSEIQIDQMTVTFKLLPGLTWSDGQALTAADSVFSYQLASDPETPVSRRVLDRTAVYQAVDETTVEWTGVPGYLPSNYPTLFFTPLPEHIYQGVSAKDMLTNPDAATRPLGWGPYTIEEWTRGDHITLQKNPAYFRADEGLPRFDTLVYRFLGEQGDNNIAALLNGECDVVDETTLLEDQLERLLDLQEEGKLKAVTGYGPEWEHIEFGIRPASYDSQDPSVIRRPNFFGDVRVRQAFALCMDRTAAVDKQLLGTTPIPATFLPDNHPLAASGVETYPYDPARGSQLLDEVGWKDQDNDPATPRVAAGVTGVADGTLLSVNYATTQAYLRQEVVKKLVETMAPCGIQVTPQYLSVDELYGVGPGGPLFGRQFDLAQFAWQADTQSSCGTFLSSQVPGENNRYIGSNVSGYTSAEYDAACLAARQSLPGQPGYGEKLMEAQTIFARDLPAIPLYFQLKAAAARPDFCELEMDGTARSVLWNLENFDYGEGCPPQP